MVVLRKRIRWLAIDLVGKGHEGHCPRNRNGSEGRIWRPTRREDPDDPSGALLGQIVLQRAADIDVRESARIASAVTRPGSHRSITIPAVGVRGIDANR